MATIWMFLFLLVGLFTLGQSVGVQSRIRDANIPQSVLDKATLGVDPVYSDLFGQTDPGMKDQIFEATRRVDGRVVLNDFIAKATKDLRCQSILSSTAESITNFNSYLEHASESVSFNVGAGFSLGLNNGLSIGTSVGYGWRNSAENEKLLEFFQSTNGEVVQSSSSCQTHVVSLNMNVKPVFTKVFIASLRKLNTAAENPLSNASKIIFREFVADFGTHYQDETLFGAQVLYESRFSEKYTDERERFERQDCVSSSFSESLQVGVPMFEVQQNFETSSDGCASSASDRKTLASLGISSVRISSVGMPPVLDNNIWNNSASAHPVPIKYRLEKMSTMFLTDWFQSVFETDQSNQSSVDAINGTAMYEFFEVLSEEYCGIMGLSCEVISKGCGYNSNCSLGEKCIPDEGPLGYSCKKGCGFTDDCSVYEKCFNDLSLYGYNCKKGCRYTAKCPATTKCVDDSSTRGYSCLKPCAISSTCPSGHKCYEEPKSRTKYMCVKEQFGTTLIAGGKTKDPRSNGRRTGLSKITESGTATKTYAKLYRGVFLPALARSRGRLFMCGGRQNDWRGSIYHTKDCYRFSGTSPFSGRNRITNLPTTAYFISAASIGDASVWFIVKDRLHKLNTNSERFSTVNLPFNAYGVHCTVANGTHAYIIGAGSGKNEIWVNKYAYNEKYWLRGGYLSRGREWHGCLWYGSNIMITGGSHLRSDVEMFNTETHIRWTGVPLPWGRHAHRMMIYGGQPTVVGGRGSSGFLRDIMRFDLSTKKWSTHWRKLTEYKEGFALLQY